MTRTLTIVRPTNQDRFNELKGILALARSEGKLECFWDGQMYSLQQAENKLDQLRRS